MAKVVEVYPDKFGIVRNVQVLVKPNQDGSIQYKPAKGSELKRHVSKLLVLVPAEEQGVHEDDSEVDNATDEDCDAMSLNEGSSFNIPDKQEKADAMLDGDADKEPGGNVAASRRSPRFE